MIEIVLSHNFDAKTFRTRSGVGSDGGVEKAVAHIIDEVRDRGDEALIEFTHRYDGAQISHIRVSEAEIEEACDRVPQKLLDIFRRAASNIERFHRAQLRNGFTLTDTPGEILGQRIIPLDRVGIYVPGGTASYPSTVLMDAIPARVAGVKGIALCSPPGKDGAIPDVTLACASIAGVTEVYRIGGAQAVAAMAYGTASIQSVSKIVGPGNVYVAEAKRRVFGLVDIDMIAGPSDILIIADGSADPRYIAADMLAQAEHDTQSSAVLICLSMEIAEDVKTELEKQLESLPRRDIAFQAISGSVIIVAPDIEEAARISNAVAPEHLEICTAAPLDVLGLITNAGSVFLGNFSPEALGDYYAGPNHTLPTMGTARFSSPLSVDDFVKKSSFTYYSRERLQKAMGDIVAFAEAEGLEAHARSVKARFEEES